MTLANDYKVQLDELNEYLSNFDNQNYIEISIKDNVLYCLFGDYEDASAKMSDIFDAEVDYVKKKVYLRCNIGNCVHYSLTNDYKSYISFKTSTGKDLDKLSDLINKFLRAYRGETIKTDDSSDDYLDYFLYDMFVGEEDKESKPTSPKSTSTNKSAATLATKSGHSNGYTEPLNKLNDYLKTFDNGYYGTFKVEGEYLIETFKSGDYSKAKMSLIDKAIEITPNNKVIIQCKKEEACVFSTFTNSTHAQMSLSQSSGFKTSELIDLINNFLATYNGK